MKTANYIEEEGEEGKEGNNWKIWQERNKWTKKMHREEEEKEEKGYNTTKVDALRIMVDILTFKASIIGTRRRMDGMDGMDGWMDGWTEEKRVGKGVEHNNSLVHVSRSCGSLVSGSQSGHTNMAPGKSDMCPATF